MSKLSEELPADHPEIEHVYDPWHFIKLIMKDLHDASKLKSCSKLGKWLPSINNMLWDSFAHCNGKFQFIFNQSLEEIVIILTLLRSYHDYFEEFSKLLYMFVFLGDHNVLREKLLSIPDHISNKHTFPWNKHHKECGHRPLPGERPKAWFDEDEMVLL